MYKRILLYLALLISCLVILSLTTRLWETDISIPFIYSGDGVFAGMFFKGVIDNGWFFENPYIGMPTVHHMYDYPLVEAINFLLIKFLAFFSSDYAVVTNLFILLGYFLSAITSLFVFRHFRISFGPAMLGSLLFAFFPYHFMRNAGHLFLANYFMIPLATMVILWVFSQKDLLLGYDESKGKVSVNFRSPKFWAATLICLLVSSIGIYYAFFTCFFLVIAGLSSLALRRGYNLLNALIFIGVITSGVLANVAPNLAYQATHGHNIVQRSDSEAEIYGLKITHLLLPAYYHRSPQLAQFTSHYNATAPIMSENTANLGIIGGIGFLFLLGWILFYRRLVVSETIEHLSILNLSAVLLATIGGFASLLTYLTHFQIRGYNRISIFIAFFSLLAIAFLLEKWREKLIATRFEQVIFYLSMGIILWMGLLDQTPIPGTPNVHKTQYLQDKWFVKSIEISLPKGTMIFQLPYSHYVSGSIGSSVNRMSDYEHLKGYLHSTHLRWSYGAMEGAEGDRWQQQVASKPADEFVKTIVFAGFGGLWLDRFGYADNGVTLVTQLKTILETTPLESQDQRYVFWDLAKYTLKLKNSLSVEEWQQQTADVWLPMQWSMDWGEGFSVEERNATDYWHWCDSEGYLYLHNRSSQSATVIFSAQLVTPGDTTTAIKIDSDILTDTLTNQTNQYAYQKQLVVPPGRHKIKFSTTAKQLSTPDPRRIFFGVYNYRLGMVSGEGNK